jgi:hypothetical protein
MNAAYKLIPFLLKHVQFVDAVSDAFQCLDAYHTGSRYETVVRRCQILIQNNLINRLESLLCHGKETTEQDVDYLYEVDKESVLKELDCWVSLNLERNFQRRTFC